MKIVRRYRHFISLLLVIIALLLIDYEGTYYGITSIFHFQNKIPFDLTINRDRYGHYFFYYSDGSEFLGHSCMVNNSDNTIVSIQSYAFCDSSIFIKCEVTKNIDFIDFCKDFNTSFSIPTNDTIKNSICKQLVIGIEYYKVYVNNSKILTNNIDCERISPYDEKMMICSRFYSNLSANYNFFWWIKASLLIIMLLLTKKAFHLESLRCRF